MPAFAGGGLKMARRHAAYFLSQYYCHDPAIACHAFFRAERKPDPANPLKAFAARPTPENQQIADLRNNGAKRQ
jgi:hypothetical protein